MVNREPAALFYDPDGRAAAVQVLEVRDGTVVAIRSVLNPDKFGHLPPR